MICIPVFQLKKGFYKGFSKNIGFSKFWGQHSKFWNFEIAILIFCRECHFTSQLVFLCDLLGQNWRVVTPHKRRILKNRPISIKFRHSMSNRCRIRYSELCVDICNGFGVILKKPGGGGADSAPQRARVKQQMQENALGEVCGDWQPFKYSSTVR